MGSQKSEAAASPDPPTQPHADRKILNKYWSNQWRGQGGMMNGNIYLEWTNTTQVSLLSRDPNNQNLVVIMENC